MACVVRSINVGASSAGQHLLGLLTKGFTLVELAVALLMRELTG